MRKAIATFDQLREAAGMPQDAFAAAMAFERERGSGTDAEKRSKVANHLQERPGYYDELGRMLEVPMAAKMKGQERAGHKYYKRIPTNDPKHPWQYFYTKDEWDKALAESKLKGEIKKIAEEADRRSNLVLDAVDPSSLTPAQESDLREGTRKMRSAREAMHAGHYAEAGKLYREGAEHLRLVMNPKPVEKPAEKPPEPVREVAIGNAPPGGWKPEDKVPEDKYADIKKRAAEHREKEFARRNKNLRLVFEKGQVLTLDGKTQYRVVQTDAEHEAKYPPKGDLKLARRIVTLEPMGRAKNPAQLVMWPSGHVELHSLGRGFSKRDVSSIEGAREGEMPWIPKAAPAPEKPKDETPPSAPAAPAPAGTPRAGAEAETKRMVEDGEYVNDRASRVEQRGEDVLGSARHKAMAWKSLKSALESSDAKEMFTRDFLMRQEPVDLFGHADRGNPARVVFANAMLKKFHAQPKIPLRLADSVNVTYYDGDTFRRVYKHGTDYRSGHGPEPTAVEHERKQRESYYEAYKALGRVAEAIASRPPDAPGDARTVVQEASRAIQAEMKAHVERFGSLSAGYRALSDVLHTVPQRGSTSPLHAAADFAGRVNALEGEAEDRIRRGREAAKKILEGKSLNAAFGTVQKKSDEGPDVNLLYAGQRVSRKGPATEFKSVKQGLDALDKGGKYGMRAVQWGKSVTDQEREHHLQHVLDSFADLTDVLGLPAGMASYNGKLGLAIGARGKGTAQAHYEPEQQVINLTRASGAGALAHEWGHFFDYAVGGAIHGSPMTTPARGARGAEHPVHKAVETLMYSPEMRAFRDRLPAAVHKNYPASGGKKRAYWESRHEVFARCFERHVERKLAKAGRKNTYLAGFVGDPSVPGTGADLWPTDAEVDAMAPHFDRIFEEFKKSELLHKALAFYLEKGVMPGQEKPGHKYKGRKPTGNPAHPFEYDYGDEGGGGGKPPGEGGPPQPPGSNAPQPPTTGTPLPTPEGIEQQGRAIVDAVRQRDPQLAAHIEQHLKKVTEGLRARQAGQRSGEGDRGIVESLKEIGRAFNQSAAPQGVLGADLGGLLEHADEHEQRQGDQDAKRGLQAGLAAAKDQAAGGKPGTPEEGGTQAPGSAAAPPGKPGQGAAPQAPEGAQAGAGIAAKDFAPDDGSTGVVKPLGVDKREVEAAFGSPEADAKKKQQVAEAEKVLARLDQQAATALPDDAKDAIQTVLALAKEGTAQKQAAAGAQAKNQADHAEFDAKLAASKKRVEEGEAYDGPPAFAPPSAADSKGTLGAQVRKKKERKAARAAQAQPQERAAAPAQPAEAQQIPPQQAPIAPQDSPREPQGTKPVRVRKSVISVQEFLLRKAETFRGPQPGASNPNEDEPVIPDFSEIHYAPPDVEKKKREQKAIQDRQIANRGGRGQSFYGTTEVRLDPQLVFVPGLQLRAQAYGPQRAQRAPLVTTDEIKGREGAGKPDGHGAPVQMMRPKHPQRPSATVDEHPRAVARLSSTPEGDGGEEQDGAAGAGSEGRRGVGGVRPAQEQHAPGQEPADAARAPRRGVLRRKRVRGDRAPLRDRAPENDDGEAGALSRPPRRVSQDPRRAR